MKHNKKELILGILFILPIGFSLMSMEVIKDAINIEHLKAYPYKYGQPGIIDVLITRLDTGPLTLYIETSRSEDGPYTLATKYTGDNKKLDHTLIVPISQMYRDNTYVHAYMYYFPKQDDWIKSVRFCWQPMESFTYHIDGDKVPRYYFANGIYYSGKKFTNGETFDVSSLVSLYVNEYYYRLDLDILTFLYTSALNDSNLGDNLTATLKMADPNNFFLNIGEKENNKRVFTLNIVKEGECYRVKSPYTFYVNPDTLQMFGKKTGNTIATRYIYLPKNFYSENYSIDFTLYIDKIGINENSFIYNFSHLFLKKMMGNCSDSKYCIIGENSGNSLGDSSYEEVIYD